MLTCLCLPSVELLTAPTDDDDGGDDDDYGCVVCDTFFGVLNKTD